MGKEVGLFAETIAAMGFDGVGVDATRT